MSLSTEYSGIVLNQNSVATGMLSAYPPPGQLTSPLLVIPAGSLNIFQDFYLPSDFARGSSVIPPLTGFQLAVQTLSTSINVVCTVQHYNAQGTWDTLSSYTVTSASIVASMCWVSLLSPQPIAISSAWLSDRFRIAVNVNGGVGGVYYTSPNPLAASGTYAYSTTPFLQNGQQVSVLFRIMGLVADSGTDILGNQYRSVVVPKYITHTNVSSPATSHWMSRPNPSQYAVESVYVDISNNGLPSVVDSVLIDPVTPNLTCNMYYSSDGNPVTNPDDWDGKLWNPIPKTYTLTKRDTYYLPRPVTASYIKLEFTNLQAHSYLPSHDKQVLYRKFPSWVVDYFLYQLSQASTGEDHFVAPTVSVAFDLLNLAYSYYQDDIQQGPAQPPVVAQRAADQLRQTLTQDLAQMDRYSLSLLDKRFNKFQDQPALMSKNDYLISITSRATGIFDSVVNYPSEIDLPYYGISSDYVSSANRDDLIAEKTYPDMFFFIPCRHGYRKSLASFTNNRAYFAGIREISFLRDDYSVRKDADVYYETFGDTFNQFTVS